VKFEILSIWKNKEQCIQENIVLQDRRHQKMPVVNAQSLTSEQLWLSDAGWISKEMGGIHVILPQRVSRSWLSESSFENPEFILL